MTREHPVLVLVGSNVKGGPVVVAKGTTKPGNFPGEKTFRVRPEQVDTEGGSGKLTEVTTFRIERGEQAVSPDRMKNRVGRISPEDLAVVRELRRQCRRPATAQGVRKP